MIKVIETNLSLNKTETIKDHQSRVVEVNSWEDYCKAFEEYDGKPVEFKSITNMTGNSIPREMAVLNLEYDDFHLSCDVWDGLYMTKKLAYLWDN